jgi:hypothetical protein
MVKSAPRAPVHLKKEELQRVDDLRVNIIGSRGKARPDVQSTVELMYLRILGRVNNRTQLGSELKELKQLLDKAAALMTEIMDKAEQSTGSK